MPRIPPVPVNWEPKGHADNLKWRKLEKTNTFVTDQAAGKRILTAKIKKKMLDKEVPYREIPPKDFHLYHEVEEKEWND